MRVAITGHASGIGQGLYNYFQERGYPVQGFDQTNGFVLPDAEDQILEQIQDCDIFINNALPVASQISLLKQLWPKWKNSDKKIIVLGSIASQMDSAPDTVVEYQREKQELARLCKSLQYREWPTPYSRCSLMIIHPGFVATNLIGHLGLPAKQCMTVAQVVNVVDYMLNSPLEFDSVVFRKK